MDGQKNEGNWCWICYRNVQIPQDLGSSYIPVYPAQVKVCSIETHYAYGHYLCMYKGVYIQSKYPTH